MFRYCSRSFFLRYAPVFLSFFLVALMGNAFGRSVDLLNRDYKFALGDHPEAVKKDFNDADWALVCLPHSFSTPYWGANRFHIGYGWYRKELDIKPEWAEQRIALDFEGVFQDCELYVNGKKAGSHKGGYTGFEIDITPFVHPGKNTIAVRVNNLWNPRLAPRAGEHVFSGGIYRDVRLVVTDPVHVAWYGTFVKTPRVSEKQATVEMSTEVSNDGKETVQGRVLTALVDPAGKTVAKTETPFTLDAGQSKEISQQFAPINNPLLWHPDTPRLYRAETRVYKGQTLCDTYTTPFGIRWFEFTKDKGFFLNGKHFYIRGANVHQDRAGWGDAAANSAFARDVKMIKDTGMNFIRGSHYPHDPAFTEACDKLGVLFWSEGVFWGIGGFREDGYWDSSTYPPHAEDQPEFEQSLKDAQRDMIRIHRNHPSIVAWSIGNEIFFTDKSVMDKAKDCARMLVDYSKELDPTRPAAVGGVQREGFDKIGDLAGYNGDGAYVKNPELPSVVAEYGSVVSHRPGKYDPYKGCLEGQEPYPWRSGEVLWCGFHHGSIAGDMGRMGFVDYARLPLRAWYWYRNELAKVAPPAWPEKGTPVALSLTADKKTIKADGTEDTQLVVSVNDAKEKRVDATPPVTLTIVSGPGLFPTGKSITFTPDSKEAVITEGWAAIEFRSYHAGKTKIKASSPGLKDAELILENTGAPQFVPGKTKEWLPVAAPPSEPARAVTAVECSQDRPTTAETTKAGSEPRFGNDGKRETAWEAVYDSAGKAWWRLDLENFYALSEVTLKGINAARYQVEITADEGKTWKLIGTEQNAQVTGKDHKLTCAPENIYGRFLRITYMGQPGEALSQGDLSVKGEAKAR